MIYQMQAEGRFPQRIKLCERAVGWLEVRIELGRYDLNRCAGSAGSTRLNYVFDVYTS